MLRCLQRLSPLGIFFTVFCNLLLGVLCPWGLFLIVSIVAFGALNLICLGLIGEYLGRIYEEVKRRPLFLIEEVIKDRERKTNVVPTHDMHYLR